MNKISKCYIKTESRFMIFAGLQPQLRTVVFLILSPGFLGQATRDAEVQRSSGLLVPMRVRGEEGTGFGHNESEVSRASRRDVLRSKNLAAVKKGWQGG